MKGCTPSHHTTPSFFPLSLPSLFIYFTNKLLEVSGCSLTIISIVVIAAALSPSTDSDRCVHNLCVIVGVVKDDHFQVWMDEDGGSLALLSTQGHSRVVCCCRSYGCCDCFVGWPITLLLFLFSWSFGRSSPHLM